MIVGVAVVMSLSSQIDGDTVTVTFEMKSGREHSTPDRALWGFSLTVRPQEMAESGSNGLPFLLDIHLSLSSVCCSLIGQLFNGAPPSKEEIECEQIMESNLLQRYTPLHSHSPAHSLFLD